MQNKMAPKSGLQLHKTQYTKNVHFEIEIIPLYKFILSKLSPPILAKRASQTFIRSECRLTSLSDLSSHLGGLPYELDAATDSMADAIANSFDAMFDVMTQFVQELDGFGERVAGAEEFEFPG
jgi:hypothetical protein